MHTLFDSVPAATRGIVRVPEFLYVKGGMSRDMAKVMDYYHGNVFAVNSGHFLIRLIQSMNVSMNRDYQSYVDVAEDRGLDLAMSLRMTSSISVGQVFTPGVFYGKNIDEVIISVDTPFDVDDAVRRWRELEPIKVIRHPFDDINLKVPEGNYESDINGIAIITVNIPLLMLQYRRWFEVEKSINPDADRTINQFVAMYPLPNMLPTHLDIAIFNRLSTIHRGEQPAKFERENKMYITDFTSKLDNVLEKQLQILRNKRFAFDQILLSVAMVNQDSLFQSMELPKVARTRQVNWALTLARLPLIKFLLKLNEESNNQDNKFYLNRIRVALRTIRNDRSLRGALPRRLLIEVESGIDSEIRTYV
jgi:hypothetical protein